MLNQGVFTKRMIIVLTLTAGQLTIWENTDIMIAMHLRLSYLKNEGGGLTVPSFMLHRTKTIVRKEHFCDDGVFVPYRIQAIEIAGGE